MITARTLAADALASRLAAKAARLAEAATQARGRRHWWRKPSLLWPLFTKD